MKISVYIATSVDGFIAREDGDIEWLHNSGHGEVEKGEDFGYEAFMSTIDAHVIGRISYEKVLWRRLAERNPFSCSPQKELTSLTK